jgi:hypothetical protein
MAGGLSGLYVGRTKAYSREHRVLECPIVTKQSGNHSISVSYRMIGLELISKTPDED